MTLVEIILYTTLLSITLTVVTNFLYQLSNFKINHQINSDLLQNSTLVFNKITQDIKKADSVTIPEDENFRDTLVLETESGQIIYSVNNNILRRNDVAVTDSRVAVQLIPPQGGFRKLGNSVQVKMSLESILKPFGQQKKINTYQTTVALKID